MKVGHKRKTKIISVEELCSSWLLLQNNKAALKEAEDNYEYSLEKFNSLTNRASAKTCKEFIKTVKLF